MNKDYLVIVLCGIVIGFIFGFIIGDYISTKDSQEFMIRHNLNGANQIISLPLSGTSIIFQSGKENENYNFEHIYIKRIEIDNKDRLIIIEFNNQYLLQEKIE